MIRAKLWLQCAAMHDPVTPILVQPAVIGWEAKNRKVDLTIERAFKGDELLLRMKGWVTADVQRVMEAVKKYGFLKLLDERELVVEMESEQDFNNLNQELQELFGGEANLERFF